MPNTTLAGGVGGRGVRGLYSHATARTCTVETTEPRDSFSQLNLQCELATGHLFNDPRSVFGDCRVTPLTRADMRSSNGQSKNCEHNDEKVVKVRTQFVRNCYPDAKLATISLPLSTPHELWAFTTMRKTHDDNLLTSSKSYDEQCRFK